MLPIVSIVGKSRSGKTMLIERLITEFKRRGYRVATLKHSEGRIDMDRPGKDSWRFTQAGSDAVLVSSPDRLAFIKRLEQEPDIKEIMCILGPEFDIVLAEGFKKSKLPKIELYNGGIGDELQCSPSDLSAVVADVPLDVDVTQFRSADTAAIADFIERTYIQKSDSGGLTASTVAQQDQ
jgi:molybdopterin-guanine dinucleotide biosynthesis protein MobB